MTKQLTSWDFTLYEDLDDHEKVIKQLNEHCKKWSFQLEKGTESGKLHYQGRLKLKVKGTITAINKLFTYKQWHLTPTSEENKDNDFYVIKCETRISGPWRDNDKDNYIPIDIRRINELYPWQKELKEKLTTYNERAVHVIFDPVGKKGKSIFTRYMMAHNLGEIIPFCNDYKDVMRMAYCMGNKQCYMIDMPRAINKEKLYQLYGAIETLKSGFCYDDRYEYKRRLMDPPNVCIFTNKEPDFGLLSQDRWRVYTIDDKKELIEYLVEDSPDVDF